MDTRRIARRIIMAMDSIDELTKAHRTHTYFDDGEGLVGVYGHKGTVMWYRLTQGGYSLVGETDTPEGAQQRKTAATDEWADGWLNGEWKCSECGTIIGRNLKGDSPDALVKNHKCPRKGAIPDDGYADGGTPYTDEEMDIIDQDANDGCILEGFPTPPLARDQAMETGVDVQDCFGDWHKPWRQDGGFGLLS